jgi:hypothetical protein
MTAFTPILRFVVYAGETGSVALQAPNTAPHQDFFMVASRTGIAGYQPYIYDEPQIDGQSLTLPDFSSTVGSCKIKIGDFRTGTSQFNRWATAFVGRSTQDNVLLGKRCLLDVSYDGGTTYDALYAGRVARAEMQDIIMNLEVRDAGLDLKQPMFTGLNPSLTYAAQSTLLPFGVTPSLTPFGRDTEGVALNGIITSVTNNTLTTPRFNTNQANNISTYQQYEITLSSADRTFVGNVITDAFREAVESTTQFNDPQSGNSLRTGWYSNAIVRIFNTTRGTEGYVSAIAFEPLRTTPDDIERLYKLTVMLLPSQFAAIPRVTEAMGWARNDTIQFYVVSLGQPTPDNRYWIRPLSFESFLDDIFRGHFNFTPLSGSSRLYAQTNANSYTEIESSSFGFTPQYSISKPETLETFLRDGVCKPLQIGYRNDIGVVNGATGSVISFFPTARPDIAPSVILDESDIIADSKPTWMNDSAYSAVSVTRYEDRQQENRSIKPTAVTDVTFLPSAAALQGGTLAIDGAPLRTYFTRIGNTASGSEAVAQYSTRLRDDLTAQYGRGKISLRLMVRRNDKTKAIKVGNWVLVDSVVVPNPSTQSRGGQRLMMVTSISPTLSSYDFELIDAGLSTATAAPTNVSASLLSSVPNGLAVAWSGSTRVEVSYGVHPGGVATLPANSPQWVTAGTSNIAAERSVIINGLQAGRLVSTRARGISDANATLQLPSAWVYVEPIQTPPLAPVTFVQVSGITTGQAIFSWVTGSALPVEVLIRSPNTNPFTASLITLPAGSTVTAITGVEEYPSTTMGVGVRHFDAFGSVSPITSASWTATGLAATLPSIAFFYTYYG